MDKAISKISALGVPGLVFVIAVGAAGYSGAVAITTALVAIGPGGIVGGIVTLGVIGLISETVVKYGVDAVFEAVVKELYHRGETKLTIKEKISKYPISKDLKRKLFETLDKI